MHIATRQLLKDKHFMIITPVSILSMCAQVYILAASIPVSNKIFVIRTSQGFGPTQIGAWWELFVPYLMIFWFLLFDTFLVFVFYERSKLVARALMWFSLALSLILMFYTYSQITSPISL